METNEYVDLVLPRIFVVKVSHTVRYSILQVCKCGTSTGSCAKKKKDFACTVTHTLP